MKMAETSSKGQKTLGKGEISRVFEILVFKTRKSQGLFGKELNWSEFNPLPHNHDF